MSYNEHLPFGDRFPNSAEESKAREDEKKRKIDEALKAQQEDQQDRDDRERAERKAEERRRKYLERLVKTYKPLRD